MSPLHFDQEERSSGKHKNGKKKLLKFFILKILLNPAAILWSLFACLFGRTAPQCAMASSFTRFLDHTQRRNTVGRTSLDERSARRRDLYLTTHNTHSKHPLRRWDSNPQYLQVNGRRSTP